MHGAERQLFAHLSLLMLFNSHEFLFAYLPIVAIGFFAIARWNRAAASMWLMAASLFFYGQWSWAFVPLLLASIITNYALSRLIAFLLTAEKHSQRAGLALGVGVTANLLLLAYFKYANFFLQTFGELSGRQTSPLSIVLPLGISFFTFTQIAFLVDVRSGIAREPSFVRYALFVTYFPHLIAGPVLHHKQMMPQFANEKTYHLDPSNLNAGLTLFTIGLLKKVVFADQFALFADPIFGAIAAGGEPKLIEAWVGVLAYSLQIYFDFSGYSDMALGLSQLFNIQLPINFNSPYKAQNIAEFWRRWHISLSTFLRDYLYIPLGGNRKGKARRYMNLMTTMLLGGLWHGAGWTFVLWGAMHGSYLVLHDLWRKSRPAAKLSRGARAIAVVFTFSAVVFAWVPFRAPDIQTTVRVWAGMLGANGLSIIGVSSASVEALGSRVSLLGFFPLSGLVMMEFVPWFVAGLALVWGAPSSQQWISSPSTPKDSRFTRSIRHWNPTRATAIAVGIALAISILAMSRTSPFLYFQF